MKKIIVLAIALFTIFPVPRVSVATTPSEEIQVTENSHRFQQIIEFAQEENLATADMEEIMQDISQQFLGAKYQAGLLDKSNQETLVISLENFDCVLFVETVLALSRNIAQQDYNYQTFTNNILDQRYWNGQLNGYCSRLHYFSAWIEDNQTRGNVTNITQDLGGIPLNKQLNFMSSHRESYPQLLNNNENYQCIVDMETNLQQLSFNYIPHHQIKNIYQQLKPGDIVGIATEISGLDVTHTGLVYITEEGNVGLIHASPIGEVTISPDLYEYVGNVKQALGIIVARPNDPRK